MNPSLLPSIEASLCSDFTSLCLTLGATPTTAQKWTQAILTCYTEPHRYYHTTEHIHSMLHNLVQRRTQLQNEHAIKLAIYFHDVVYDPRRSDNEVKSKECFGDFAADLGGGGGGLEEALVQSVQRWIEATITHSLPPASTSTSASACGSDPDLDLGLFLDLDLEVLCRPPALYALYVTQIRNEYAHLSDEAYCIGRLRVLKAFLQRERLYFTDVFRSEGEERARGNLRREVEALTLQLERGEGARH